MLRTHRFAVAVLMLAALAPPVAGGYIAQDTGVPNPATSWSPDNQYYVTAYGATANALNYPLDGAKYTPAEIIQHCMNMQLVYAHTMGNWPLPVKGDTFSNLVFTISNYKAITIGTTMADSTAGASIYIWPQTLPAGEQWLQLVHLNYQIITPSVK